MVRDKIFISYCHEDRYWLDKLQVHLKSYFRGSSIFAWDDTKISPGTDWREEIAKALASTKVAVLLVSPDSLASDFICQKEIPYLMEAADKNQLTIIPVAVRHCSWWKTPFESTQWANSPEKPLSDLAETEIDKALVDICKVITDYLDPETFSAASDSVTPRLETVEEGLNALIELMRNPQVQRIVAIFEGVFKTSSRQIEVLAYYKDLHDLLHTLQLQCYNYLISIVRAARKDPDDISIWDNVVEYELTLKDIIRGFENAIGQTSPTRTSLLWINKIIQDLEILCQAIQQKNAEQIDIALKPIQRVLATKPSRINDRLVAAAEALPMPELIEALTSVRNSLDGARVDPVTEQRFIDGVKAIKGLDDSLNKMIDSHNKLQEIDLVLRRIEANMAIDFSELENSWNELKTLTETQCDSCDEEWAQQLRREIAKLDQALIASEPSSIRHHFRSFKIRTGHRFYHVDLTLKKLCEQLRKVGEPLTTLLELINEYFKSRNR